MKNFIQKIKILSLYKIHGDKRLARLILICALILTLAGAIYFFIFSKTSDAFSFGGVLLTVAFGLIARYWLRPLLAKKWNYFQEKKSAPYIIAFLIILVFCAIFLTFKKESIAEHLSVIGYFLLVMGVGIEFWKAIKSKNPDEENDE